MSTTSLLAFALLVVLINLSWSQPGEAALTSDRGDPEMIARNVREPQENQKPWGMQIIEPCRKKCKEEVSDKCSKECSDIKIESLTGPKKYYFNEKICQIKCLAKNKECIKKCPALPAKPSETIGKGLLWNDML